MTRTSSNRTFRRAFVATVAVLAVVCAAFVALNFVHGPKLESAQVDLARVIAAPAQQLRLFANQPLASVAPEQVTITPATAFTVDVSSDVLTLQFTDPLAYNTDYSVIVDGVTNAFDDQASTLAYEFRTAAPDLYYLDRGVDGADDQILRGWLTGAGRAVVFWSPGIQDFVRVGELLAVVLEATDDAGNPVSLLRLVSLTDGGVETVNLPAEGTIGELHGTDSASLLGFTFTSAGDPLDGDYDDTLLAIDLAAGRSVFPLSGLADEPLEAADWLFVPETTTAVARTRDNSVLLVEAGAQLDAAAAALAAENAVPSADAAAVPPAVPVPPVIPLGQFETLGGVSPDGTTLTVTDRSGTIALDLATREESRIPPSDFDGTEPYGGDALARADGSRLQHIAVFDDSSGRFASYLVLDDGSRSRVLYRTVDDGGEIGAFGLSPNSQYVAIEVVPDVTARESDGYAVNPRATTVTTVIVDVETGALVRSVDGFALAW